MDPRAITVVATAGQSKVYGNADPVLAYDVTSGTLTILSAVPAQPAQSILGHTISRLTPVTFAPNAEDAVSLASCDPVVVSSFLREEAGGVLIDPVGQAGCGR